MSGSRPAPLAIGIVEVSPEEIDRGFYAAHMRLPGEAVAALPGLVTALVAGETDETAPLVVMIGWSSPTPVTGDPGAVQSRLSWFAADAGGIGPLSFLRAAHVGSDEPAEDPVLGRRLLHRPRDPIGVAHPSRARCTGSRRKLEHVGNSNSVANSNSGTLSVAYVIRQYRDLITYMIAGRRDAARGNFGAALTNRVSGLEALDGWLGHYSARISTQLQPVTDALSRSLIVSVAADGAHLACRDCPTAQRADALVTAWKSEFVRLFNPYANTYLSGSYTANEL